MTQGLDALRRHDYEKAADAFRQVLALDPSSSEGAEGLVLAEAGLKREQVRRYKMAAEAHEEAESWAQALISYEAILAVDGALGFAQEGRSRAQARDDLDRRLRYHIGHPDRLSYDEVLEEVDELLQEARSAQPQGPVLRHQILTLQDLATGYRETVLVTLESDELTDVLLHRVGRLGRFLKRDLDLRPGVYTLVGSRDGYRDVRIKLRVDPKAKAVSQDIRCREAI
jgi:tetratricopeptide (TPR) repeat protein